MKDVSLDDKYTLETGRIFLTGSQALVRLPIMQRQRDLKAGKNTAGFISGYRGSPLGIYDLQLWAAKKHLKNNHIHFEPGVNEDLAATSVWGSQQVGLLEGPKYDGVFSMWYGKGPGVDRSGDAMKHGSFNGASALGGVLCLAGDDHGAKSSTICHQSEQAFMHFAMPVLNPATVQDYLDLGLHGFAMSRFSGCWIGFICTTDTVESSASCYVDPHRVEVRIPEVVNPPGGVNIAFGVLPVVAEVRQYQHRLIRAQQYALANKLDKQVFGARGKKKLGIITTGKSYLDVRDALDELDIDDAVAEQLGLGIYKVALTWPMEPTALKEFASQCETLLVVEEKRAFMEEQIAAILYNEEKRPLLIGKKDEQGLPLVPSEGELEAKPLAGIIGRRVLKFAQPSPAFDYINKYVNPPCSQLTAAAPITNLMRMPSFCSGCPHNTSTNIPEGSIAMGGIGCHGMAVWLPERRTVTLFHMGGEGAPWIGQAPFTNTAHIFQNLGDGTYFHSGLLAIRATAASGVNITFKILLNGTIAMTGGQPIEGGDFDGMVTAPQVAHQVHSEGVHRIAVVSDDIGKHRRHDFPKGTTFHHRDDLNEVQKELREWKGTSVLIYDQNCAAEKRRLRKRGEFPDPQERMFINELVCEGCGDCGVQSNCIAIEPVETEFGRKRRINQSSCNKDYSCVKGFCPSFVTVKGGSMRKMKSDGSAAGFNEKELFASLPLPKLPSLDRPFSILVTGIGGTGVVTIGALLGMASHLEEKGVSCLDVVGLSQKNGPVTSHVRIGKTPEDIHAVRIASQKADLIIGCDMIVTAGMEALSKIANGKTALVVNNHVAPTSAFASNPNLDFSPEKMQKALTDAAGADRSFFFPATNWAAALFGDAIASNLFQLGFAFQKGYIPLSLDSIMRAIEMNGVAVTMNKRTFTWGRLAAVDMQKVQTAAAPQMIDAARQMPMTLDEVIAHRVNHLTLYQDAAYAARYKQLVDTVRNVEKEKTGKEDLSMAVAKYYSKLLAVKDEYEVARLYSDGRFKKIVETAFEGNYSLHFNLAPEHFAKRNPITGRLQKMQLGPYMMQAFKMLAKMKFLRFSPLDIFNKTKHRKMERQLAVDYAKRMEEILEKLNKDNHSIAVQIANIPEEIRGYDIVKDNHLAKVNPKLNDLMNQFRNPDVAKLAQQDRKIAVAG
jgi:indolepyruvate ferredoxin oxidoreductase